MQSTKNWLAHNLTIGLSRAMDKRVFLKRHMRSADVIVIVNVFLQNIMQMSFVENYKFSIDIRPADSSRFPFPVKLEAFFVPANNNRELT